MFDDAQRLRDNALFVAMLAVFLRDRHLAIWYEDANEPVFWSCLAFIALRRLHLRGRENILKRLLLHVSGFNLSLVMRKLIGKGTPRGLQGSVCGVVSLFWLLGLVVKDARRSLDAFHRAKWSTPMFLPWQ